MSHQRAKVIFPLSVAFLIPALLSFAQAPAPTATGPFKVRSIRQQLVTAPDYRAMVQGGGTRTASLADKWLKVETEFDSGPDWADDVQLKYFVLMGKDRSARMFTGETTYVNVAKGARHLSAMFAHPNTVQRYGNGQVEAVAVQIFYKGQLIDQESAPPTRERWWERYTPVTGFLLNPQQTPWSLISYDTYEALKPTP